VRTEKSARQCHDGDLGYSYNIVWFIGFRGNGQSVPSKAPSIAEFLFSTECNRKRFLFGVSSLASEKPPMSRKANTMKLLQNLKRKSVARRATTLIAALVLGTAVTTAALAAGHGGGGGFGGGGHMGGGGGGFGGGGHIGGGGGAFGGGHFAGGGFGGRMSGGFHDGDHFGGGLRDRDRRFGERFGGGGFAFAPGYDDYGYDSLSDYAGGGACYQYREVYTTAGWQWRQLWVCD
jgi:hypothetical protein